MLEISHAARHRQCQTQCFYEICAAGVLRAHWVHQKLASKRLSSERRSVFGRIIQLYVELHAACLQQISQQGGLQAKLLIHVEEENDKVN